MIPANTFVMIEKIILPKEFRSPHLPDATRAVDVKAYIKGLLIDDAILNQKVTIITQVGLLESGTLIEVHPSYSHSFGDYIEEMAHIGPSLRDMLKEGDE